MMRRVKLTGTHARFGTMAELSWSLPPGSLTMQTANTAAKMCETFGVLLGRTVQDLLAEGFAMPPMYRSGFTVDVAIEMVGDEP